MFLRRNRPDREVVHYFDSPAYKRLRMNDQAHHTAGTRCGMPYTGRAHTPSVTTDATRVTCKECLHRLEHDVVELSRRDIEYGTTN